MDNLLDKLFRRHSKELLSFATQRAGGHAEDLVQEAFVRLLQHPDLASIDNLRAFLFRTTSNLSIDLHRRQQLEARYKPDDALTETALEIEVARVAAQIPSMESHLHDLQELEAIGNFLDELPEITRYVYVLNQVEGLTHAEIAKRLGISLRSCHRHFGIAMRHMLNYPKFKAD